MNAFAVLNDTYINLALNKTARQSSTYLNLLASRAVDGRHDTMACTSSDDVHPWWAVDLGAAYNVRQVTVISGSCKYRQTYFIC